MRTVIICFLVFVVMSSIVNGQPKDLKPPCEFILLIDGSKSVTEGGREANFQKMVDVINKWPDHFLISEQASRVAVIQFGGNATLELPLTGDEKSVRGLTFKHQKQDTNTHRGLEMVKNDVFNLTREDALKIVIIITDGESTEKELANKAAENLREAEAVTYALFIGDDYKLDQVIKNHVDNGLAGDPERVFNINDFAKLTDKFIQDLRNHIECDFEEVCQFDNGTTCHNAWVRRTIADSNHNCTNAPSKNRPFKKKCNNTDVCDKECDKWWKWADKCDDTNAGKAIKVNREGPKPDRESLDNCPLDKEFTCPSKPTQPATDGSTEDPKAKDGTTEGSDSGGGLPWWVFLIIALVVLLVLIAIVVLAVVVVSRKKKRAKEAKEKGDAEAAKKKADQEKADKEKAAKMGKSKMEPASIGLGYSRGGKGADDEMGVSLRDEDKTGKKRGKSVVKKSTPAGKEAAKSGKQDTKSTAGKEAAKSGKQDTKSTAVKKAPMGKSMKKK